MGDEKKYRCAMCGTESDQTDECCGQPMEEVMDEGDDTDEEEEEE